MSDKCDDHGRYCWQNTQEVLVDGTDDNPLHYEWGQVLVCCRCQKIYESPDVRFQREGVTRKKQRFGQPIWIDL